MKAKKDLQRGIDFIGITCVFYCHDGQGNFLMHKRSKNCRDEIGWFTKDSLPEPLHTGCAKAFPLIRAKLEELSIK